MTIMVTEYKRKAWKEKPALLIFILLVSSLVATAYPAQFTYSCPDGWAHPSLDSNRCYKLLADGSAMKWAEAQVACEEPSLPGGSYLFVPSSMEEEIVMQSIYQSAVADSEIWIGCSDLETNTTFICYHENEVLTYKNWSPGNPDENKSASKQNGATMNIQNPTSGWVQQNKNFEGPTVCELPATEHAISSFSQTYVIKHDTSTGVALQDWCQSSTPIKEPFGVRSGTECGAACNLWRGCYSFNFIRPPGQPGEGRCELMGADNGDMHYEEGCKYFVMKG
ncbi:uncharacterized protein LOC121406893 [Lytechinus variegatus]|uniref:uncharacterized protein LOC121406893 n=1 Tax=Lytechinus variegatus TaxID=7654 RepID=UPI001BB1CDC6|nr:uncharacterized protein LOC121406893 [Lytechinus variegatus]